jgi:hypothetical protein
MRCTWEGGLAYAPAPAVTSASSTSPLRWIEDLRTREFTLRLVQFIALLVGYQVARVLVAPDSATVAIDHARDVIALERRLGLFFEEELWSWVEERSWLELATATYYRTAHVALAGAFFIWLWLARRARFRAVWWWFWAAHLLALGLMALYPTAPPRLVPELGFVSDPGTWLGSDLRNDYAAIPSLHVGYPVLFAAVLVTALRAPARWLALLWPLLTWYAVMATGNHYWLDAVAGVAVVTAALPLGIALMRIRDAWLSSRRLSSRRIEGETGAGSGGRR